MSQMTVHGVLVQRDKHVDLVAHIADRYIARPDGQEGVPAANQRLIGVVSVQVKPSAGEYAGENISWGCDSLPRFTADADCEIYFSHN